LDGITIFDLTDPQNPRYCHTGRRYETSLGLCELLNGEQYCRTYFYQRKAEWHSYDEREEDEYQRDEQTVAEIVTLLQDEKLIDPNVLLNAWNMPWCVDDRHCTPQDGSPDEVVDRSPSSTPPPPLPSLAELSCKLSIQQALKTEDPQALEDLARFPNYIDMIRETLASMNIVPDAALPLLAFTCFSHDKILDLSCSRLSGPQLPAFIPMVDNLDIVEVLDVAFLPGVDKQMIIALLDWLPRLRRVCVWETDITSQDLSDIFAAKPSLIAIDHPASFSRCDSPTTPAVFSIIESMPDYYDVQFAGGSTHVTSAHALGSVLAALIPVMSKMSNTNWGFLSALLGCEFDDRTDWNTRVVTHSANLKMDSSVGPEEFPSALLGEGLTLIVQRLANYQYTMGFVQFSTASPSGEDCDDLDDSSAESAISGTLIPFRDVFPMLSVHGAAISETDLSALDKKIEEASVPQKNYSGEMFVPFRWMREEELTRWIEDVERRRR
jgi:hypothetical protein